MRIRKTGITLQRGSGFFVSNAKRKRKRFVPSLFLIRALCFIIRDVAVFRANIRKDEDE